MQYDPIKKSLGNVFNKSSFLRISFYKLLDLLLLRTWHIKKELKSLKKTLSGDSNFLDAGSGYGQYTHFLGRKFRSANIYAVDVKEEQIKDCNRFFSNTSMSERVKFAVEDLTMYSEKEKYKLILSVDVMEHIEDDIKVFQNFYASLKKEGVLLISTPSDEGGSDVHDDHEDSFIDEHVRDGYNLKEIEAKLRSAGFSKIYTRYSYGCPGKISWKLSMKYPISLLNINKAFFIILPFYYLITFPFSLILNYFDISLKHKTGTGLIVKAIK